MAGKAKDPVKQRAGKRGAEVRWQRTLAWMRRLVQIRGGTFGTDWRVNLQGVALMYVFLWRTTPPSLRENPQRPRELRSKQEIKVSINRAIDANEVATARRALARLKPDRKIKLPPRAIKELEALELRCDTGLSLEAIAAIASYSDRQHKFPWIHTNWRYETLERMLRVTGDEIGKLEPFRSPRRKPGSREASKLRRQAAVLNALAFLRRKGEPTSIRQVQRILKKYHRIDLSCETVRKYLNNLPKR